MCLRRFIESRCPTWGTLAALKGLSREVERREDGVRQQEGGVVLVTTRRHFLTGHAEPYLILLWRLSLDAFRSFELDAFILH